MEWQSRLDRSSSLPRKDIKIDIIIPTLNEEQTIGILIQSIPSFVLGVEVSILIVDGGSIDRT
ncbi:MAG TPA: hypothetical protein VFY68_05985, partial [Nitrososphaeraceae archaeon]|nr:hypothetical protein [Nitrososphaeraceae archaeon]